MFKIIRLKLLGNNIAVHGEGVLTDWAAIIALKKELESDSKSCGVAHSITWKQDRNKSFVGHWLKNVQWISHHNTIIQILKL